MPNLIIYLPNHGYSISQQVYVSWLDDNYYIRDPDNVPVDTNSFMISTDDTDNNLVQFVTTITSGYVRRFTGAGSTTISGLDHLIGETVKVVSGGIVIYTGVVDASGEIIVDSEVTTYAVGKPYTCKVRTTRLAVPSVGNSVQGQVKRINRTTARYVKSKDFEIGQEYPVRANSGDMEMTEFLSTADVEFSKESGDVITPTPGGFANDGLTTIKSEEPFPLTVIGTIVEFSIDETR